MAQKKILVIDDEETINKLVCSYLKNENYIPLSAYDGRDGLLMIKNENPDLIILDVMLPDTEGTSLSLEIRKISNAPIIFLSCKTQSIDKIMALSAGGDDYMTKPFVAGELIARIKAHLRRQNTINASDITLPESQEHTLGDLTVDFSTHEVYIGDNPVDLTKKEFEILKLFVENPKKVFSAKQIYESIWKTKCMENDDRTVMVYISTLRKKLENEPDSPNYIKNARGIGYRLNYALIEPED